MPPVGLGDLSREELIAAVRMLEAERAESLNRSGRMLAELHDRHGLSWPAIADVTGISQTTAYRRATPFLASETGPET